MATMVYDENFGKISYTQRARYRKFNVSPSDHDDLVDVFGETAHEDIIRAVEKYSPDGMFDSFAMVRGER